MSNTEGIIASLVIGAVYFFPMAIAFWRDHPSKGGITVLNLIFGWTVLGWFGALIWAFSGPNVRAQRSRAVSG